jgi:hypothetical protein
MRAPPTSPTLTRTISLLTKATIALSSTPRWNWRLGPIEIWFSILVRKLLRRANFTSKKHLQQRIESFIAYFNATMFLSASISVAITAGTSADGAENFMS